MDKITTIETVGISAQGKKEIVKHLEGNKLTHRQAILAKCYECMGHFTDGRQNCFMTDCPLYPFMPYRHIK